MSAKKQLTIGVLNYNIPRFILNKRLKLWKSFHIIEFKSKDSPNISC